MKYLLKVFGFENYDKSISRLGIVMGGAAAGDEFWLALHATDAAEIDDGFGTEITYVDFKDEREAQGWVDQRLLSEDPDDYTALCQKTFTVNSSLECLQVLERLNVSCAKDVSKAIAATCVAATTSGLTGETFVMTPGAKRRQPTPLPPVRDDGKSLDEVMDELEAQDMDELDRAVDFALTSNENWGMFQ